MKVRLTTTFALLKKAGACADRYRHLANTLGGIEAYGKDTPITLAEIIESNGMQDAIWALHACAEDNAVVERIARLFAADCAEAVLHLFEKKYPKDDRPRKSIQAARDFANGKISAKELSAARAAARDAARAAARDAAWAAWAAARDATRAAARDAARDAAWAAARDAARDAQKDMLLKYIK